ncbi:MAG: arsenic resistance N-acetyltransferase ArsN2 [bacterium]
MKPSAEKSTFFTEAISPNKEVLEILRQAQLPTADIVNNLNLLGMREAGRLVGVVGIEVYGRVGMLRSLAVVSGRRKRGLGVCLVSDAETWAVKHGIRTLYLLTKTAEGFFAKLGYEAVPRSEAPAAIAATAQFSALCPASSTLMRKELAPNHWPKGQRP